MTEMLSARVRLDARRRPTLPRELLEAAGVGREEEWVARVEGPGRIVLESTATVLAALQAAVAASRTARTAPTMGEDSSGSADVDEDRAGRSGEDERVAVAGELPIAAGGAVRSLVEELFAQRAAEAATEDERAAGASTEEAARQPGASPPESEGR